MCGANIRTAALTQAIRLVKLIHHTEADLKTHVADIAALVAVSPTAGLTQEISIGPVSPATALVAWSHAGRLRNKAVFAFLSGTSPLLASSGNTTRYRVNRGATAS